MFTQESPHIALSGKNGEGKFTIVDPDMYDFLNQFKWHLNSDGYAQHSFWDKDKKKDKDVKMHQLVRPAPPGFETDHISTDKLDNRRVNLRVCTHGQNMMNRGLQSNNTSGYKNIYWSPPHKQWRIIIKNKQGRHNLGLYRNIEDAVKARDKFLRKFHGDYANLN